MTASNKKRAIFLDRDGVINVDNGYVSVVDDFEFIDGVIEALQRLKDKGYLIVVITNQSGIARGYFTEEQFHTLTEWMDWSLVDRGVELDGIYYCPHHAEYGIGKYKMDCECRKPKAGMINEAVQELNIDITQSILVGDKVSDIQAGLVAGITTNYLVRTGKAITTQGEELATAIYDDLASAVETIQ
ncbi:D-glycero-beta-D-manno-heptose-1,7-bisphosphate 7-phosphatase [Psychromonas sp. psych-6C06]|uniref:D-glycero-beta-D-manno-heptose 1,7-bisphosphate 7-phosphatase n=1 Tax=Psychromonas sp. psych-6C06 TaxID=2058089 RepID=UPI000C33ABAC|nr:D-glycero-beta-D-manno-heptose 1,7-bisphosphate 7-phosphatase [Psychromonas sp. psych-6C06]PKF61833.1 D-glycero-beta-D-manno-heptose-1,7-bisphosphate 7-phosphatase [Psychromonas sp. psych-6C06]